jgi:hypothetical protein
MNSSSPLSKALKANVDRVAALERQDRAPARPPCQIRNCPD